MKKGFVVSAILYPLFVLTLALILGIISMSDNRRKILDNMKLEVSEESETDPEMSNSALYYKMKALEEAYAEMASRLSEERFEEIDDKIRTSKNQVISAAKLQAFPVGSIFTSTTSTNPSSYIGGTWEEYGQGRTLIGVGTGTDTNSINQTFSVGSTGGEYSHELTITEMPSHTHIQNAHSHSLSTGVISTKPLVGRIWNLVYQDAANMGSANGIFKRGVGWKEGASVGGAAGISNVDEGFTIDASHDHTLSGNTSVASIINQNTGGDGAHNNIQPYIVVYFWKRIS